MVEIPFIKNGYGSCTVKGLVLSRERGEGIYPSILTGLFNMRKVVKRELEDAKDELKRLQSLLDADLNQRANLSTLDSPTNATENHQQL